MVMFLSKRFTTYKFNSQNSFVKNSELPNGILNDVISEFRCGTEISWRKYRTAYLIPGGQVVECFRLFGVAPGNKIFFFLGFFFRRYTNQTCIPLYLEIPAVYHHVSLFFCFPIYGVVKCETALNCKSAISKFRQTLWWENRCRLILKLFWSFLDWSLK